MNTLGNCTVAVTGGCGFIGSHLIARLRNDGVRVIIIDSLEYGQRTNVDLTDPDITIEKLVLRSGAGSQLREILRGVDYLFHLAAEKHNQSIDSPGRVLDSNVMGTYELLSAAADTHVKKVVFTSSLYAYGRAKGPPMSEDEVPTPDTVYGISKLSGEHLCRHFHFKRGLPAVCLRLFFVYGPRQYTGQGYKSVIMKGFDRLLKGQKPVINGDGGQELDYIYVEDVVSSLLLAMSSENEFDVLNVGNGSGVSVNGLTGLMTQIAGTEPGFERGPADSTHGTSRVANTRKFDARFGRQPRVPLQEGLRRTFDWIVSSYKS